MKIPPAPKWDRTIDGLESPEQWMKSLLPAGTVFPQMGQTWEAVRDCGVACMARFTSRAAEVQMVTLRRGQKVRVVNVLDPFHLQFVPLEYEQLETVLVPKNVRSASGYTGYDMIGTTEYFNEVFQLTSSAA